MYVHRGIHVPISVPLPFTVVCGQRGASIANGGHRSQGEDIKRTECLGLPEHWAGPRTCTKHSPYLNFGMHRQLCKNGNCIAQEPVGRLGQQPFSSNLQCTNPDSPAGLALRHHLPCSLGRVAFRFLAPPKIAPRVWLCWDRV